MLISKSFRLESCCLDEKLLAFELGAIIVLKIDGNIEVMHH